MNQRKFILLVIIGIFIIIVPTLCIYFKKFGDAFFLSNDRAVWGQFGDYIGGVLNPLLSLLNVIILVFLTLKVLSSEENRSIRPLGALMFNRDYNSFELTLVSCGAGPLIVNEFKILDDNGQEYKNFKEATKDLELDVPETKFIYGNLKNLVLPKDRDFCVAKFEIENTKKNLLEMKKFFELLNRLTIVISYSDINNKQNANIKDKLSFEILK